MGFRVHLERVSKRYTSGMRSVVALDEVTLLVPAGQAIAVSGPSGSGKSTLLHVIGAMAKPDRGSISVDGLELTELPRGRVPAYRRQVGFIFQQFHLIPTLSALDNVLAPLVPFKTTFDRAQRAKHLMATVGLDGKEDSYPGELSGGEQQRVAIARALINDPGLLLADEPTGNLDSSATDDVIQLMLDLRARRGTTLIVATHDEVVASQCDRIVTLRDGRVEDDLLIPPASLDDSAILRLLGLEPE